MQYRNFKDKNEWMEQEQLLLGEKESLSTLSTHLKHQLEDLQEEHKMHQQLSKNESESFIKEKTLLTQQLVIEFTIKKRRYIESIIPKCDSYYVE